MAKLKALCLISLWLFSSSCTKENQEELLPQDNYPYVSPGKYFPIYPGSSWRYIDNYGDTVMAFTDSTLFTICLQTGFETYEQFKGIRYHPPYNSDSFPELFWIDTSQEYFEIVQYNMLKPEDGTCWGYRNCATEVFLCDTCYNGDYIYSSLCLGSLYPYQIIDNDTSIQIGPKFFDSVIHIKYLSLQREDLLTGPILSKKTLKSTFYAKDIGLIKEVYSYPDSLNIYSYELLDFAINNPNN